MHGITEMLMRIINEITQRYNDHPSITKQVIESDIYKFLKNKDDKNPTGIYKIPPKLAKKTASIISKPLCDVTNNSLLTEIFPEDAKVASVLPGQVIRTKFQIISE